MTEKICKTCSYRYSDGFCTLHLNYHSEDHTCPSWTDEELELDYNFLYQRCEDYIRICKMMRAPIIEMKSKPNCEKLPEILKKLHIPEEKHQEIRHELKNNARKYEIIDILEELSDMMGKRCTHENTYKLYCINRDLKQLRAPLYQENMLSPSEERYMPHEFIAMTVKEIVHEYEELNCRMGFLPMPVPRNPTKEHVMHLLDELLKYDVIYEYRRDIEFIEMPLDKVLPDDHEICVLRIL